MRSIVQAKMKPSVSTESTPIGQRLKLEMKRRGMTSAELAKAADVKTSFLYDVISGKSANPSTVKLARVAEALGISLSWLVGSTPERMISPPTPEEEYVSIQHLILDIGKNGPVVSTERRESPHRFHKQWIRDHLHANPEDLRLLQVRGDSMEPTLYHNDFVLVDTARRSPSPPGIFVLFDGFGLTPKRLEYTAHRPPQVRVVSDNPHYSTYERGVDEACIIGRVAWFSRDI